MPVSRTDPAILPGAIDRTNGTPLYAQLRHVIAQAIDDGILSPGAPLPGEMPLCARFDISRTAVRQALAQLEHEGAIERIKGKGTFVARPKADEHLGNSLVGLYTDVQRRGGHVRSDVIEHRTVTASIEVAEALEVEVGSPVVVLERLRWVDDEPWALSRTWMPTDVGDVTFGAPLRDSSLYALLADNGIVPASAARSLEATVASPGQAPLLGLAVGAALLRLRSISRDASGRPIEYFMALHRGDRSRFSFDLQGAGAPWPHVRHVTPD